MDCIVEYASGTNVVGRPDLYPEQGCWGWNKCATLSKYSLAGEEDLKSVGPPLKIF